MAKIGDVPYGTFGGKVGMRDEILAGSMVKFWREEK